jgi:hypothetical protein
LLPLVSGVRAGTQNLLVRQLAITAGELIGENMRLLEGTGLVDYALLPPSTAPTARLTAIGDYTVPVTLLLFIAAVLVCAVMLRGLGRSVPPGGTRNGLPTGAVPRPRAETSQRSLPKLSRTRGGRGW